jgi:hypothetical protein
MAAMGTRVTTTTQSKLMPYLIDTFLNSNVFATRQIGAAKRWSGERMKFPIKWKGNVTGTSFAGYDTFSTAATDNRVNMEFVPKFYQITVTVPLDEVWVNNTDEKVMDLIGVEVVGSAQDMANDIGTLFYSDGTGNGSKDFLGLAAIVDDGGAVATYGTLSRATYTTIQGTDTSSSGTLTLAKMDTLYNAATSGAQHPTCGFTTEAVFSLYGQLLQPQERINKDVSMIKTMGNMGKAGTGFQGGTGFTGLFFKGFPILGDEKCNSGELYFINENYVDFYALDAAKASKAGLAEAIPYKSVDIQGNDYSDMQGLGFCWSGWVKPTNSASIVGHVYLGGELIGTNPKRNAVLDSITSV